MGNPNKPHVLAALRQKQLQKRVKKTQSKQQEDSTTEDLRDQEVPEKSEDDNAKVKDETAATNDISLAKGVESLFPVINTQNLQQSRSATLRSPFRFLTKARITPTKQSPTLQPTTPEKLKIGPVILRALRRSEDSAGGRAGFISPKIAVRRSRRINSPSDSPLSQNWTPVYETPTCLSFTSITSDEYSDTQSQGDGAPSTPINSLACRYKSTIGNKSFLVSSPRPLSPEKKKSVSILSQLLDVSILEDDGDGDSSAVDKLKLAKLSKRGANAGTTSHSQSKTQEAPAKPENKNVSHVIPFDWTLKKEATFLCNCPFKMAEQQHSEFDPAKTPTKKFPRRSLLARSPLRRPCLESPHDSIDSNLSRWVYPASDFSPSYSLSLPRILEKMSLEQRLSENELKELEYYSSYFRQWVDAFESLYESFSSQAVKSFYYLSQRYTVLFVSSCVMNTVNTRKLSKKFDIVAIITPATPGMQKRLGSEGIVYSAVPKSESGNRISANTNDPRTNDPNSLSGDSDNNPSPEGDGQMESSTIVIIDQKSIQKLCEHLTVSAREYSLNKPFSLPTLLSEKVFLNASFQKAKIVKNDKVRYDIQDPINSDKIETMHKLQIRGVLPPMCLNSLLKSVRLEQACLFDSDKNMILTVTFISEEKTLGLNEGYIFAKSLLSKKKSLGSSVATLGALLCKKTLVMWK